MKEAPGGIGIREVRHVGQAQAPAERAQAPGQQTPQQPRGTRQQNRTPGHWINLRQLGRPIGISDVSINARSECSSSVVRSTSGERTMPQSIPAIRAPALTIDTA